MKGNKNLGAALFFKNIIKDDDKRTIMFILQDYSLSL